jgi:hypothetical protein
MPNQGFGHPYRVRVTFLRCASPYSDSYTANKARSRYIFGQKEQPALGLLASSDESRFIILENLHEKLRLIFSRPVVGA